MRWTPEHKAALSLAGAFIGSCVFVMAIERPVLRKERSATGAVPTISPRTCKAAVGDTIVVRSSGGGALGIAEGGAGAFVENGDRAFIIAQPDVREAARIISIPISLNWRHPLAGLPSAQVIRVAERDHRGRYGPDRLKTLLFADHGQLPVLSLALPNGALFDPDSGLMVVGNGIFHASEKLLRIEYHDPKWWKYPGNFHLRGKAWERKGRVQFIGADGEEVFQSEVGVRINGQMTRAFPQHALRLDFPSPVRADLFGEPVKEGYTEVVMRAAGNDQIKAMLRDAFQHELCKGLPFDVSGHRTCVVYINGAYWGVHHIRHRMDENELARRYGISAKNITILEDEARFYRGDTLQTTAFKALAARTADWDGTDPSWADSLARSMDVDGFLSYMAAQMILCNVDWPEQNVKFWRYGGKKQDAPPLDGRWYFIMGDSDLGYGVAADARTDMFSRVNAVDVPITKIFRGMMRDGKLRQRFIGIARSLAKGPLSATRSSAELERFIALMAPEMERHTARWRRPADVSAWTVQLDVMRTFAREREAQVLRQLDTFEQSGN